MIASPDADVVSSDLPPSSGGALSLALVVLVISFLALAILSPLFAYEKESSPVLAIVVLLVTAGVAYLVVVRDILTRTLTTRHAKVIILTGLCMRALMLPSVPMQEDDYYRYLWDGAMVAHGWNPYQFVPQQIVEGETAIPETVRELANQSRPVIERINHPWLRTIYPPTAQAPFALAHAISPWSLVALRVIWLGLEAICILLIISLLGQLKLPVSRAAIWWLNPILVKEIYNSGHMELTVVVFVLLALWLMAKARPVLAGGALGLAAAAKIWPVLLLPLLLRAMPTHRTRLCSAALFLFIVIVSAVPILVAGLDSDSGFTAYAQRWEMNDLAYMAFNELGQFVAGPQSKLGRILVMVTIASGVVWLIRKPIAQDGDLVRRCLLIAAMTFLLSPTQMPWYYLWLLPLLPFWPLRGLLLLSAMLPLYYLRFALASVDMTHWFDHGIIWLEHLPVWIILVVDAIKSRRAARESAKAPATATQVTI